MGNSFSSSISATNQQLSVNHNQTIIISNTISTINSSNESLNNRLEQVEASFNQAMEKRINKSWGDNTFGVWKGDIVENFSDYPYIAAIIDLRSDELRPYKKTLYDNYSAQATFIKPNFLLTAGHVAMFLIDDLSNFKIAYGGINLKNESQFTIFNLKKAYLHPEFVLYNTIAINDLAVIEIEEYNNTIVQTIELVNGKNKSNLTAAGIKVRNIGWGMFNDKHVVSSQLRYGDQLIQTDEQIINYLNKYTPDMIDDYNGSTMIGAGGLNYQHAYQGDSGGPLLSYDFNQKKDIQIGVTSWGPIRSKKEEAIGPGIFTRLSKNTYLDWIVNITNKGNVNDTENKSEETIFNHCYHWLLRIGTMLDVAIQSKFANANQENCLQNEFNVKAINSDFIQNETLSNQYNLSI